MSWGYIRGADRQQRLFLPECVEDCVGPGNPVRIVDAFVESMRRGGEDGETFRRLLSAIWLNRRSMKAKERGSDAFWLTLEPFFARTPASGQFTLETGLRVDGLLLSGDPEQLRHQSGCTRV